MYRMLLMPLLALGFLTAVSVGDDDEPKVAYPKPGAALPGPFHTLNVTGPRLGRYHSLVCRNGLQPAAVIFVRPDGGDRLDDWLKNLDPGQPLATLIKKLDDVIEINPDAMLGAFVVYSDSPQSDEDLKEQKGRELESLELLKLQNKVSRLPEALGAKHVVQTLADNLRQKGMAAWKFPGDSEPEVAVVIYDRQKVVGSWAFTKDKPLTDKDVTVIAAAFDKRVPNSLRPRQKATLKLKGDPDKSKERIATPPKEKEDK